MNHGRRTVFYGWKVVLTAALGLFWGVPVTVYTFSIFVRPFMHDYHVGRAAVSLAYTAQSLAAAFSAPVAGWLIDRYGSRRVILPGTAMFGAVLVLNILFLGGIWHLYFFYIALGVLMNGVGPIPYGHVISHWFHRRRGLALGLTMVGIGSGAMIMPSLAQQLITRFGWHTTFAILGAAVLLISLPITAAFLKQTPQELNHLPDGAEPTESGAADGLARVGMSAGNAWRTGTFWLMLCAFFLMGASVQGCLVHFAPMLADTGAAAVTAALGSSIAGGAVLIGRIGTGYLLDRLFAPYVAALLFGGTALGIGLLWIGHATPLAFTGAFLIGLGLGAEIDIITYLIGFYFGLRDLGKLYSVAFGVFVFAGAIGPLAMGAGFDLTGSYRMPLAFLFGATVLASLLMTRVGLKRYPTRRAPKRTPLIAEA